MAAAGLVALRISEMDVREPLAGRLERRSQVGLLDVHVEDVAHDEHRAASDALAQSQGIGDRDAHIVLVTVDRLDVQLRPRALGARGEAPHPLDEDELVRVTRAAGCDVRQVARATPDRHDDAATAELAGEGDETREILPCEPDLLGSGVDEPAAVAAADRRYRDVLAKRDLGIVERLLRELDRFEPVAARLVVLLAQRRARQETVLDREAHALPLFHAMLTHFSRDALSSAAAAKRA